MLSLKTGKRLLYGCIGLGLLGSWLALADQPAFKKFGLLITTSALILWFTSYYVLWSNGRAEKK